MHELGIMSAVVEAVEQHAQQLGARQVLAINLVMGERSGAIDDSLLFYFDMLTPGTLAEGAQITIRRTPMQFHCPACDDAYAPSGADFCCPRCSTVGQVIDDATQLLIESIEIET